MFRRKNQFSAIAMALAACLAIASAAQAGGYPANGCVAKKQAALGKYASAVGKAWAKYPTDSGARGTAIASAFTKLNDTWGMEQDKAASKNTDCTVTTSTSTVAATAIDDAATTASGDAALTGYIAAVMKAYGKYIKDPVKDPGKAKLNAALTAAATDKLTGASPTVTAAAAALESDLVAKTTTSPDYADTFQSISPGATVNYAKQVLKPECVDGTPYMYFAKRGSSNNVLMYYQGGGACWSDDACFNIPGGGSICSRTADASDNPDLTTTGFANYNDPANPFHDWSVVFVSYCTCDVHWGDNIKAYNVGGHVAHHVGRVNAAVAEKFAREHFMDPDRVFVTGSSAGSYGAIMNSYYLMKDVWPNADFGVLGDAGVGVITKPWLDTYIKNWGVAANFPTDLGLPSDKPEDLSLVDLIDGLAKKFPNARFANYDSSYDGGGGSQTQFFQVMRYPTPPGSNIINNWSSFWESTCQWNACMREFKAENSTRAAARPSKNYHSFTGAGSRHTIFGSDKIFTETKSTKADGTGVTFISWVQAMIDDTADWVDVDCNNMSGDCSLSNTCQGGTNRGGTCTSGADCPGGSCQQDPDTGNAPYAGDHHTVTCAPTTCPCGLADAKCVGGAHAGDSCVADIPDCKATAGAEGSCVYVNCPTFTP